VAESDRDVIGAGTLSPLLASWCLPAYFEPRNCRVCVDACLGSIDERIQSVERASRRLRTPLSCGIASCTTLPPAMLWFKS